MVVAPRPRRRETTYQHVVFRVQPHALAATDKCTVYENLLLLAKKCTRRRRAKFRTRRANVYPAIGCRELEVEGKGRRKTDDEAAEEKKHRRCRAIFFASLCTPAAAGAVRVPCTYLAKNAKRRRG